ncbi:MAG: HAD-IA family hydrolase [Pseudomonadota bacterium]
MTSDRLTIVYDLDGTLVDSNRDLIPALNRTTAEVGLPSIAMDKVGHVVGRGAKAMIARAFEFHKVPLDDALHEKLFDDFLVHYEAAVADKTIPFDGVIAALKAFQSDGHTQAVCTNKFQGLAEKLLNALHMQSYFSAVTGGDTFDFKKPDGRHITQTVELAGGNASRSVMIGDSISDIAGAKDAGIPVVAVDFGYTDRPVEELNPDRIVSHFDELPDALRSLGLI